MEQTYKKVAIIGAGASGLTATKCCLEEGLKPVCFEKTDQIGGLWHFTPEVREGQACVMKSTIINSSKEMMAFSDFPPPRHFATFMHNTRVWEYLRLYAERFQLLQHVRFGTEVVTITKGGDFQFTGRWNVQLRDNETQDTRTEVFDAVMICTGHHANPHTPQFPGLNSFKGETLHTHDYKEPTGFEDKRVVVVGIGNSAGDVAVELSRCAKNVFLSTRRGAWVLSRLGTNGMPGDMEFGRRFGNWLASKMSPSLLNDRVENMLNRKFDHRKYGLNPTHRFAQQHPMVNDELPGRIAAGKISVKPNVKLFTANGVEFDDGSVEDDIDVVIFATGYKFGYPFLPGGVVEVEQNTSVNLYKYVFPPDLETPSSLTGPTLGVIGLVQPVGSTIPIAEMQSRWVTRVFTQRCALPSRAEMWEDIQLKKMLMQRRYVESQRHTLQVDYIPYMDEIASLVGCQPDFASLWVRDPRLAASVVFGPCTSYQFRLRGPGAWPGARQAILAQWNRVYPTQWTEDSPIEADPVPDPPSLVVHASIAVAVFVVLSWFLFTALQSLLIG